VKRAAIPAVATALGVRLAVSVGRQAMKQAGGVSDAEGTPG
jgi:hypothetical protein